MFGLKKEFQVLVPRKGVEANAEKLKSIGVHIFDVRAAEICDSGDNHYVDTAIVLRCRATGRVLDQVKSRFDTEREYEGYRTFF